MRYEHLIDTIKIELEKANERIEQFGEGYNPALNFEKGMATGEQLLCEYLLNICDENE